MSIIVFDLEWNQSKYLDMRAIRDAQMAVPGDIIQIGAVKLDADYEIIDSFNCIVKPAYYTQMHAQVSELTGITNEDLEWGLPFEEAIRHFSRWCGEYPRLLSWGNDDIHVLEANMRLYRIQEPFCFAWHDAQKLYAHKVNLNSQQVGLQKALEASDIPVDLTVHNALHDAMLAARLLKEWRLLEDVPERIVAMVSKRDFWDAATLLASQVVDNYMTLKEALGSKKVKACFCPVCGVRVQIKPMERYGGARYMSIGKCPEHGRFVYFWRTLKYSVKKGLRFCVIKSTFVWDESADKVYAEKAAYNAEKARQYRAFMEARAIQMGKCEQED